MADDTQAAPPVTLDSVRQKYPQYKDVDDDTLARGLHQKFYSQMPFNDFAAKVGYKPAGADTSGGSQEQPSAGTQIGHGLMDTGAAIAGGVGSSIDIGRNLIHAATGQPQIERDSPESYHSKFAAPFQHAPDAPEVTTDPKEAIRRGLPKLQDTAAGQAVVNNPIVQNVGHDLLPVADAASSGAALAAAPGLARAGLEGASDMLGGASKSQAARVASNPGLVRARADGFKLTADDVRGRTNPADTSSPNSDLPGPSSTTPDTQDAINVHNQTHGTKIMAQDVKLKNTRAVNADEVSERMSQEGKVYGQVGDAIGTGREPTPVLDHDLSTAGTKDADPAVQAKIDKDVSFYRDQLKGPFDGPKAVQTVRTLRNSAQELNSSTVPGDKARGAAFQNMANAIEDEMMRQLPAGGPATVSAEAGSKPAGPTGQDLRTLFPAARQQLAKLYELNEVTDGGQVNPAKVAALKKAGKPLTGAADAVANAAETAPQSMQGPRGSPSAITTAPTPGRGFWIDTWNVGKAAIHKIPGFNPASDAYQASRYGGTGGSAATPPASAAPSVSEIRKPVDLKPPPGNAGNGKQGELPLPPGPPAPPAFELQAPEGTAHEPAQRSLIRNGQPGKVMDPAEWDRQALARVRQMSPTERAKAEGPAVPHDKLDTTVKSRRGRSLGQAFNRERE